MLAAEFQAKVVAGKIEVPKSLRDQFEGEINVILFAMGEESSWPKQNQRRWELIAKMARQTLEANEAEELAELQRHADEQVKQLGPRPTAELEGLYAKLAHEG